MTAEQVAVIRDLTIILFALAGVLALVVGSTAVWRLYRKASPILDSTKETVKQAQETTSLLYEKVVKPMAGASTFGFSAGRVLAFVLGLSRGKGGKKNGK